MLNAIMREFRISKLPDKLIEVLNFVSSAPGTLGDIAGGCGHFDYIWTEHALSLLVDEELISRSVGNREYAVYRAA